MGWSGAPARFSLKGSFGQMSDGHSPQGLPIARRVLFLSAIITTAAGVSSCASLRTGPERIAQLFLKAYLEGDADGANKYLSEIYGPLRRLKYVMDVDGLPTVLSTEQQDEFGLKVILEAHGTLSHDPVLRYLIEVYESKVVDWDRRA